MFLRWINRSLFLWVIPEEPIVFSDGATCCITADPFVSRGRIK